MKSGIIRNHQFKHESRPNGYGCFIKATRNQNTPVRASLGIYIDIVIDEPRQDEFALSRESSIALNCKVDNRDPNRDDFFGDSKGPFTLITLNKAKTKISQLIARLGDEG